MLSKRIITDCIINCLQAKSILHRKHGIKTELEKATFNKNYLVLLLLLESLVAERQIGTDPRLRVILFSIAQAMQRALQVDLTGIFKCHMGWIDTFCCT